MEQPETTNEAVENLSETKEMVIDDFPYEYQQATIDTHESANEECAALHDFTKELKIVITASDKAVADLINNQFQKDEPTQETY